MRSTLPTTPIALSLIAVLLAIGLTTSAIAQDGTPPEPMPPDAPDQLLELPGVGDDIDAFLRFPPPPALGEMRKLSASDRQACVLLQGGLVFCWPLDGNTDDFVPPPHDVFATVTVGLGHACAIDGASRPICWGDDRFGQLDAPNEFFVDIAAGDHHTCGLDVTGEIHCWGRLDAAHRNPPSGPFEEISAGGDRTCVSGRWERSRCFGASPVPDEPFDEVVRQIETSSDVVCALDLSNRPMCEPDPTVRSLEPPSPLAADIAVGSGFMCTLEPSGAIRCDGPDAPTLPQTPPISQAIDAGEDTLCAVTVWGELQCWDGDGPVYRH